MNKVFQKYWLQRLARLVIPMLALNSANAQMADTCVFVNFGQVKFTKNNTKLTPVIKKRLDSAIILINKLPKCAVKVIGSDKINCDGVDKEGQQSWDRVNSVVTYLVYKRVSKNRIIFQFSGTIEPNYIELRLGGDDELQLMLQPHPNLRQNKNSK